MPPFVFSLSPYGKDRSVKIYIIYMKIQKQIIEYRLDYLDYLEIEKGLSDNSQKNYSRFLLKFFDWLKKSKLNSLKPNQLTKKHIWEYRVYLSRYTNKKKKAGLKKSTQNLYLIAVRSLLEFFVEKEVSSLSPAKIKLVKNKEDKEIKFLNLEQLERLLLSPNTDTLIGLRDRAILETLFSTGLRVEELTNLNRDQFKINNSILNLEIPIIGKGKRIRTVYFSERAVRRLQKYLDSRKDMDNALFINYSRALKNSGESKRLTKKSIDDIVKKYVKIAGLPVMATPHTLRHSFATDLLNQGVDLRMVQEFLGHRNIATTQIYTHVTNKQLRDIHKKYHGGKSLKNN